MGRTTCPLPYEFSLGVPLADVPMARSALLLLRWMNDALLQDQVSWLLLSGFLCEQLDELLPIAEFDVNLRRRAMRQPEQDLDTFLHSANPPDKLRRRLQAGRRLLSQNRSLDFAQWVHVVDQILDAVHWPGAHVLQSEGFQVQARWSQLLDNVAALAFDGRMASYAEFFEALEWQAEQTIFAPNRNVEQMGIAGPLEAAGLTFDALWFLGADDASWPAVARPHPFLPRSLQRTHNMPHADSTADWKLFSRGDRAPGEERGEMRVQFFVAKCGGCLPPIDFGELREAASKTKAFRMSIGADESSAADEEFLGLLIEDEQAAVLPWPIEQDAGGAEILRRQAACPFQSFATRRLGARPMDAADWGLEPRERGSVVHKILESLWAELKTRDDSPCGSQRSSTACTSRAARCGSVAEMLKDPTRKHRFEHRPIWMGNEERIVSLIEEWLRFRSPAGRLYCRSGRRKACGKMGGGKSKTPGARGSY